MDGTSSVTKLNYPCAQPDKNGTMYLGISYLFRFHQMAHAVTAALETSAKAQTSASTAVTTGLSEVHK